MTITIVDDQPERTPRNISFQHGVRVAVAVFNSAGGLFGQPVRTRFTSVGTTPLEARHAARQLAAQKTLGIIGPPASTQALAMAEVLERANIVTITPTATHPDITRNRRYMFRTCNDDTASSRAVAQHVTKNLGFKRIVVVTNISNDYSISMSEGFVEGVIHNGGQIIWRGQYLDRQHDFTVIIEQLKRLEPDCIFLPDFMRQSGLFMQQARAMGVQAQFIGADAWNLNLPRHAGSAAEGAQYFALWLPEIATSATGHNTSAPTCRKLPRKLRRLCKSSSDAAQSAASLQLGRPLTSGYEALGFDAAMVLLVAAAHAGSYQAKDIRDTLEKLIWHGMTGTLHFSDNGTPPPRPVHILQMQNGVQSHTQTIQPEREPS
ncbi:ABC transporter substrate-binding protein [Oleidesulfovibrio sp.]|uniref:ABC transporter substrate-binding protein n=1 Tax=Oleidesulfovibrio sp. TaxID=2909707 RepID=UPI003A853D17